ncbi:MAG: DNA repair protein RadA, partial [Bacteriovoracia bacterium]
TFYSCKSCGYSSAKWLGRCAGCGEWNTLVEERSGGAVDAKEMAGTLSAMREEFREVGRKADTRGGLGASSHGAEPWVPLYSEGTETEAHAQARIATGLGELDRVLGGGLVPGSFVLLGGDPGIGKSTLLLQMAKGIGAKVLYVSGEESIEQIRGRAHRLGVSKSQRIFLAAETQLEKAFASVKELEPDVLIMDSLQTFASAYLESAPGSVSQVREIAARLMTLAKTANISVWLVGHVTKDGSIAGPKVVEHMVDTVLYFEGDEGQNYRLIRAVKNRFGSARELGVFEMDGEGLREVTNPSSLFLSERRDPVAGTAITACLEGTRPLLVELQALVSQSILALPRRTSVGLEGNRLSLLSAILERHMKLSLADKDLFFNVAGGLRLDEPACDLAAAAAIWSSLTEKALPSGWVWIGEVGLTGEVRRVSQPELRVTEAMKLGFKAAVIPEANLERCAKIATAGGMKLLPIQHVDELRKIIPAKPL